MTTLKKVSFGKLVAPKDGTVIAFVDENLAGGSFLEGLFGGTLEALRKAAEIAGFTGKKAAALDLIAPTGLNVERLIVVGLGKTDELSELDWQNLGGTVYGLAQKASADKVFIAFDLPGEGAAAPENAAGFAAGMKLRSYKFDDFKTKKADEASSDPVSIQIGVADTSAAKKAWGAAEAIADGVILARDLVDQPANVLGPVEFAARAEALSKLGVEVEVLGEKEMKKLKMDALLGVSQGAVRPPRLAVMRWNGGKKSEKPVAFVGKGVVFDTGGISIKPSGGMEEMKGDMGGAATVVGVMHALAARKAKVNAIGVIGLVENMPDGNAQRPGDIVTAMSGTTIEILNTDAEGRLVLADALWYTQEKYKPAFVIDLATLTGAIIVALGHQNAGLYSNDDTIADQLKAASEVTGEGVWRMPLSKEYDKIIDTPNADVKNTGGRWAGSITAAQFLQRFIQDGTTWVHLDIAGPAFGGPKTEICQAWASGFGVRLLDRLVSDNYEGK